MILVQYGIPEDEIPSLITYVRKLPPIEIYTEMLYEYAVHIREVFKLASASLDAFFSDKPNPLDLNIHNPGLIKNAKTLTHRHLAWASIIFQAEPYLQIECKKYNVQLPPKRSDLLKILWLEECIFDFYPLTLNCYEELSGWQLDEISLYTRKFDQGEIRADLYKHKCSKWEGWREKLVSDCSFTELLRMIPWTLFCAWVLTKYRNRLLGFEAWEDSMGFTKKKSNKGKTAIINKEIKHYPGRGKGKK